MPKTRMGLMHLVAVAEDVAVIFTRIDFEKLLDDEGWDLEEVEAPHRPVGQTPGVSC